MLDHQTFLMKNNPKIFLSENGEKALFWTSSSIFRIFSEGHQFPKASRVKKVANLIKYTKFCVPASDKVLTQERSLSTESLPIGPKVSKV